MDNTRCAVAVKMWVELGRSAISERRLSDRARSPNTASLPKSMGADVPSDGAGPIDSNTDFTRDASIVNEI